MKKRHKINKNHEYNESFIQKLPLFGIKSSKTIETMQNLGKIQQFFLKCKQNCENLQQQSKMSRDDGKQRPVLNEIYKFSTRIFRLSEHGPGQRKSNDWPSFTWPSLTTTGAVLVDPTQLAFPFQLWSSLLLNVHVRPDPYIPR